MIPMRSLFSLVTLCLLSACATKSIYSTETADLTTAPRKPCAIIIRLDADMSTPKTKEQEIIQFWEYVSAAMVERVYQQLRSNNYQAFIAAIPPNLSESAITGVIATKAAKTGCGYIIQIPRTSSSKTIGYSAKMLTLGVNDKRGFTISGATYERNYSYPLTAETLDNIGPDSLAKKLFKDMESSGALEPLRIARQPG